MLGTCAGLNSKKIIGCDLPSSWVRILTGKHPLALISIDIVSCTVPISFLLARRHLSRRATRLALQLRRPSDHLSRESDSYDVQ
jgi:hypothetical protein